MVQDAELAAGDGAVCESDVEFCENTMDFCVGDRGPGGTGEFAGEIGRAKAAVRGVGVRVRVAEAVALRMSREGAAASIGKSKLASSV